ncbi:MAG: DUF3658 domain-containing protein [Bacilli bacterium]
MVFGNYCYKTIKNSKLGNQNILMINTLLNIGDLSNIKNYEIKIPKELYLDKNNNCIKEETNVIIDNINKMNIIRVWTGHNDIYSYLIMLFVSSIIKEYNYELYVLYCDDYNKDYSAPSVMREEELEDLTKFEHKLTKKEIIINSDTWEKLVKENTDLRVIEKGNVKSVSLNYYDKYILDTLKVMGKVKIIQLVGKLMKKVYLQDTLYVYLINRLIKNNKIKIILDNDIRYFESLIEIIDN